jgi:uncharacterized protein YbjT (DUF2867 family)
MHVAVGDYNQPDTFARAAAGVDAGYIMSGSPDPETFRRMMAATKGRPLPRIVFQSTTWASPVLRAQLPALAIGRWHEEMEGAIHRSGSRATFLRPSAFMTNTFAWIGTIKAEGVVYNPWASAQTAPIAPEDIAAVAVKNLTDPQSAPDAIELTGGELLTVADQVAILGRVLGKPLRCVDVPVETAVGGLMRNGAAERFARAVGESFEAVRAGKAATKTDAVEKLLGRAPTTFEAWARKHAARFT